MAEYTGGFQLTIKFLFLPVIGEYLMAASMLSLQYLGTSRILSLLMDGRRRPYCVRSIRNHTEVFTQRPMEGKPGEPNKSQDQADDVNKLDSVQTTSEESPGGARDSGIIRISYGAPIKVEDFGISSPSDERLAIFMIK